MHLPNNCLEKMRIHSFERSSMFYRFAELPPWSGQEAFSITKSKLLQKIKFHSSILLPINVHTIFSTSCGLVSNFFLLVNSINLLWGRWGGSDRVRGWVEKVHDPTRTLPQTSGES